MAKAIKSARSVEVEFNAGEAALFGPLLHSSKRFYAYVGGLVSVIAFAGYAYYIQLTQGLIVTGMREPVIWGLYISNFVFFIGISHAGTLISAILRVSKAEWRRPITRMAESITVMAISVAALYPLIDLGRPDRIANVFLFGRIQSPIIWDFISIGTYLTGSLIYLYLPLIPDIADIRDRVPISSKFKRWMYNKLSLGWKGTREQKKHLEKAIGYMAIIIIPVAISVHTVVSWIFVMTLRVGWHSAMFGPYFVTGAIFSGIASIIIAMAIFRRIYHLEMFIKLKHFKNLGYMLVVLDVALLYFIINEFLTAYYGGVLHEVPWLTILSVGEYAVLFWFMIGSFLVAGILIGIPATRSVAGIVVASFLVVLGMWIERFVIVVPSLAIPQLEGSVLSLGAYLPTWVEWAITAGGFALFILLFSIFSKIFPIVSHWEVSEGAEKGEGAG